MTILGIDLGTTNSACSVWKNGELVSVPNRLGEFLTPSVVGVDSNGDISVGSVAKQKLIVQPSNNISLFKRLMGTEHKIKLGKRTFSAPELSSFVIRSLIEDAEVFLDSNVTEAVISVPAYFNENQRQATKIAGELAGVKVRRLINEPTAAAMAYGLNDRQEGTFMILDMGGGTFDVSILEYFEGVMEVHASAGDNSLGGEDFVDAMVDSMFRELGKDKDSVSPSALQKVYLKMESVKRSIDQIEEEKLTFELDGDVVEFTVSKPWFEKIATPLLLKVKKPIQYALSDANLVSTEIDDIILVGGATRLKHFRSMVARLFGKFPSCSIDPDIVVGLGAGIQAGLMERNKALEDIVLTDVCPFTLGTEVNDDNGTPGFFLPIIERNTVVPVSLERTVVTSYDNQVELTVRVFQGENRQVAQNVFLGLVSVKVPKDKRGAQAARIRYSYDSNGLLEVDITIVSTGKTYNKVIENAPGMLSSDDIQRTKEKLAKIKFHPREDEEVSALLAKGERMYATALGDKREQIASILSEFEKVLDKQQATEIKKAKSTVKELLEQLDGEEWF